jgi:hypothetical protein
MSPAPHIVYGTDAEGRPACIDLAGPSPHVLISGATGSGLTTLAGIIAAQAARNGTLVRCCHPRAEEGTWTRGVPGITPGLGLEETVRLVTEAREEMRRRLMAVRDGADAAMYPRALVAVDDCQLLAGPLAAGICGPAATALAEIAAFGRAVRVTILIAAHLLVLPFWPLDLFGTRIMLGHASRAATERLFGDAAAGQCVPGTRGAGLAAADGRLPTAIRVITPSGGPQ